jgi:hypothetical protein
MLRKKMERATAKVSMKVTFSALYGIYTVTLQGLKAVLKAKEP